MTRLSRIVVCTALVLAVSPAAARAFDLTGHWVGKTSCKGLGDGAKFAGKSDIVADVSQSGRDVNIAFQGFSLLTLASAIAVPSVKNADKGELGFVACDNEAQPVFGVTGRAKVTTKPSKGSGTVKLTAIVAGKDLNGLRASRMSMMPDAAWSLLRSFVGGLVLGPSTVALLARHARIAGLCLGPVLTALAEDPRGA